MCTLLSQSVHGICLYALQEGGDCGSCGYSASRIKGYAGLNPSVSCVALPSTREYTCLTCRYWPSAQASNWAWVYPSALSDPQSCSPLVVEQIKRDRAAMAAGAFYPTGSPLRKLQQCTPVCLGQGKYVVAQPGGAMVRGGTSTYLGVFQHAPFVVVLFFVVSSPYDAQHPEHMQSSPPRMQMTMGVMITFS